MADKKTEKKAEKPAKKPAAKAAAKKVVGTSKLATFLTSKKIDPRRVVTASHGLETLRPEDRAIRLKRRQARGAENADATKNEHAKPRSGRAVTARAMNAALTTGGISGPTKTRILRAVNHLLEQKKAEKVDIRTLF